MEYKGKKYLRMVGILEDLLDMYWRYTPMALIAKAGMPKMMAMVASVETISGTSMNDVY